MITLPAFWLGDDQSLQHILTVYERQMADPMLSSVSRPKLMEDDDEGPDEFDPVDDMIQVSEGVGILSIEGPMVAAEHWSDHYFGVISYPMISRGMLKLAERYQAGELHAIVHAFDTSGGSAEGISGLSTAMKLARRLAPNTVSWTGTKAFSAGYWGACTNPRLVMEDMAEVGSIGVISVARSMSRLFEEMGIDNKVIRSGKFKALGTPFEPLSDKALAEIQRKGDQLHGFFKAHVLESRKGLSTGNAGAWGEGQTFFGSEAVDIGLADETGVSLSALVSRLVVKHNRGQQSTSSYSTPSGGTITVAGKQVVFPSEGDRAAAAAGVPLDQIPHQEVEPEPASETPPSDEQAQASGGDSADLGVHPLEAQAGVVGSEAMLAKLLALTSENTALKARVETLEAQVSEAQGALPAMQDAVTRLQVAAGWRPTSLAGLSLTTLAAQYREAKAEVDQRFPTGRRSIAAQDEKNGKAEEETDPGVQRLNSIPPKDSTLSASRL